MDQQNWVILKKNKVLLLFPILRVIISLAVFSVGIIPIAQIEAEAWLRLPITGKVFALTIAGFLLLFILNLISFLFNAALITCTIKILNNETYSFGVGFKTMFTHFFKLITWIMVMITVGTVIRLLQFWMDNWFSTKIAKNFLCELTWSVATYFVLPILLTEKISPLRAITHSAKLAQKNPIMVNKLKRRNKGIFIAARFLSFVPVLIGIIIATKSATIIGSIITVISLLSISILNSSEQIIILCKNFSYVHAH